MPLIDEERGICPACATGLNITSFWWLDKERFFFSKILNKKTPFWIQLSRQSTNNYFQFPVSPAATIFRLIVFRLIQFNPWSQPPAWTSRSVVRSRDHLAKSGPLLRILINSGRHRFARSWSATTTYIDRTSVMWVCLFVFVLLLLCFFCCFVITIVFAQFTYDLTEIFENTNYN